MEQPYTASKDAVGNGSTVASPRTNRASVRTLDRAFASSSGERSRATSSAPARATRRVNSPVPHPSSRTRRPGPIPVPSAKSSRRRADRRGELFAEGTGIGPGRRVLELGCGTGEFTRRVARAGAELVALDLSPELLAKARSKVRTDARFVRGDATVLPFPTASFDAVYGCSILHHLDVAAALTEVRRVLRPGGRLVFSEPNCSIRRSS